MKNITLLLLILSSIILTETIVPEANADSKVVQKQSTGTINGNVNDENGDPLKGANVMVAGKTWGAETDTNGYYFIKGVREGEYMLRTQYLGCSPKTKKSIKVVADSITTQNFKLRYEWNNNPKKKDFGHISGTVINQDEKPLKGAKVTILGIDSITVTNEDGRFYFKDIKCGKYNIQAELSGYEFTLKSTKICYGILQMFFDIKLVKKECNDDEQKVRTIDMGTMEQQKVQEINDVLKEQAKPIIYIYPEEEIEVNVKLDIAGRLTSTYPKYPKDGWTVNAKPNGNLTTKDGREFYSLYWEGISEKPFSIEEGFIVKKEDTIEFLENKLKYLGLNSREANEFIIYWLPKLESKPYNMIHFSMKQYQEQSKLIITPQPETLIRVFMVFQGLDKPVDIKEQNLTPKQRKGYTVVEWGGCDMTSGNKTTIK